MDMRRVHFERPDLAVLRKEHMVVDMHFHTKYSYDSSNQIDAIVRRARSLKVQVAITDHNTAAGALAARRLAPDVIRPGIEICTAEGKDVIPYFYTFEELDAFYRRVVLPGMRRKTSLQSNSTRITTEALLDELSRENCVVSLPHPFAVPPRRSYPFFSAPRHSLLLRRVHAIEAINATMTRKQNLASVGWSVQHGKALVGGSDGHTVSPLGDVVTFAHAGTWEGFLDEIRAGRAGVVGIEHRLPHKMLNATRMLREKARIIKNLRPYRK